MVGVVGFEPTISRSQTERFTRLSHTPKFNQRFRINRAFPYTMIAQASSAFTHFSKQIVVF